VLTECRASRPEGSTQEGQVSLALFLHPLRCTLVRQLLKHPLCWPAFQRVARRCYCLARFRVRRHEIRRHVAGHAVYGANDTPRGGLKQLVGSAEVDGGLGYAGYRDQLLPKERITEAMDRLFREVDDDAHGNRLGLRIFRSGGRRALTRQRQRRVGCLRRWTGDHRSKSEDARASSEHR
jgi:hypothetical protein